MNNNRSIEVSAIQPKSPKSRDASAVETSFAEMNDYMVKIKDSKYKDYIQKKYELIVKAFHAIDKDSNAIVEYQEMLDFLNASMKEGKKFDEDIAKRIFDMIDINGDNQVSLYYYSYSRTEFAKTYIQIEEELKMQVMKLKSKYDQRSQLQDRHFTDSQRYKNEKLNEEGVGENARLIIGILSLLSYDEEPINGCFIRLVYKEQFKKTAVQSSQSENEVVWGETFEFKVESLKDRLTLEICEVQGNKEIITGSINIPLTAAENQDEYECEIEIPDQKGESGRKREIKLKIQLIKSFYTYYSDLVIKIDQEKKELTSSMQTIQKTFDLLNAPFGYFEELNRSPEFAVYNYKNYFKDEKKDDASSSVVIATPKLLKDPPQAKSQSDFSHKLVEKLEKLIKSRIGEDEEVPWFNMIKYLATCILCALLVQILLAKSELFSLFVVSMVLAILIKSKYDSNSPSSKDIKLCFYLIGASLLLDLLGILIFSTDKLSDEDAESGLKKLAKILFYLTFFCKKTLMTLLKIYSIKQEIQENSLLRDMESNKSPLMDAKTNRT